MAWADLVKNVAKTVVKAFPTSATYTPLSGSPYSITCVFDAAYIGVEILDGAEVQSVYPRAFVAKEDLVATPVAGDKMTINGTQYRVAERRPDGEAGYLLVLGKL